MSRSRMITEGGSGVWIPHQPHQRLMLVHFPLSHHYHLHHSAPTRLQPWTTIHMRPSPLYRDVGRVNSARPRDIGGRNTRGGPGSGRPTRWVTKTGHDKSRGPFLAFPLPYPPLTTPLPNANTVDHARTPKTPTRWANDHTAGLTTTRGAQRRRVSPNDTA